MKVDRRTILDRYLRGITHLSVGPLPDDCPECEDLCVDGDHDRWDPWFSWYSCEACGSTLGGMRYPIHGVMDEQIVHMEVCEDCVQIINKEP